MLVRIPQVLTPAEVAYCRERLEGAGWVDGKATAGQQSAKAKFNLQVPGDSPEGQETSWGDALTRSRRGDQPSGSPSIAPHIAASPRAHLALRLHRCNHAIWSASFVISSTKLTS